MDPSPLTAFVDALPKVELHLHLEGSVRPATLLRLAARHGTTSLPRSEAELRELYRFRDFDHFVEVYMAVCDQLRDAEDFALIVAELGDTLQSQNVRYAEVTFTPANHLVRGVPAAEVFAGVEEGRRRAEERSGVALRFVTDIPGEMGPPAGMATVEAVLEHRRPSIIGFGLGGTEVANPRHQFAEAFTVAREAGLHSVPHAGETGGAAAVWSALRDLGAERIGHGIRCLEDPALVEHLRAERVPLEVCPTSNLRTGVVASLEEHPLPRLLEEGLVVTLNSDDPPMFGTTLREEYLVAGTVLGLSPAELADLARAGVRASFLAPEDQQPILDAIDAVPLPDLP